MIRDFHSDVELFFKKDDWERFRDKISEDDRILVKGVLEYKRDKERKLTEELQITVEETFQLDYVRERMVKFVHVNLDSVMLTDEFLQKLEEGMQRFEPFEENGGSELVFHVETESHNEHVIVLRKQRVDYTQELADWLVHDMGVLKFWVSPKSRR